MEKEIAEGKFIEHANVHGNIYGTSFASVMNVVNNNKICILDIDVQGVQQVMKSGMKAEFVFIKPPTYEELVRRLTSRGTDSEESIKIRLANSKRELDMAETLPFNHVIINNNLDEAYAELRAVIYPIIENMRSLLVCEQTHLFIRVWWFGGKRSSTTAGIGGIGILGDDKTSSHQWLLKIDYRTLYVIIGDSINGYTSSRGVNKLS